MSSSADKKEKHEKSKKSTVKDTKKRQGSGIRRSVATILKAVKGTGGIISQICERLSCDRKTVYNYISRHEEVRLAIDEEKEDILDACEEGLFAKIYSQEFDAIKYYLERKGKCRGYGGQDQFGKGPEEPNNKQESGVLVTPGLLSEEAWEAAAQK